MKYMRSQTKNYIVVFYLLAWFFLDFEEGGNLKAPVINIAANYREQYFL